VIALVVLNEGPLGSHPDIHEAFKALVDERVLDGFEVYAYPIRQAAGVTDSDIAAEIRDRAEHLGAGVIVWMHTRTLDIPDDILHQIRRLPSAPVMAYWEGDSYHPRYKPLPRAALRIMRRCDVVFLPCGGPILGALAAAGCHNVRYAPSCASDARFPLVWQVRANYDYDLVLVGNRVHSRRPFSTMPGARRRTRLVRRLQQRYGSRFAVFGAGWSGPSAMGPCTFDEQALLYSVSAVAVGVNNSTYPLVFSNRLPICLASGVPLAYSRNPGFEEVFDADSDDMFFSSSAEAIDRIDRLLSCDATELLELSSRSRGFFERNLTRQIVCRHVVEAAIRCRTRHQAGSTESGAQPSHVLAEPIPRWQSIPPLVP
jgi:hypothetical protein